jgi:hypothetical protein
LVLLGLTIEDELGATMQTKETPAWVIERRNYYLEKASTAGLLDAVFYATYFNESDSGNYFACPIDPRVVAPDASDVELSLAIDRSRRLHHGLNAYVGEAFFKYPGCRMTYEQAIDKLKQDNPGFCEDVYSKVIHDNLRGMR